MKKACVIGWPIAHSRSPLIHNYWLKQHKIDGLYEKREVRPDQLNDFLLNLKTHGYEGCNITIPHKEAALTIIKNVDDVVRRTGSLNTVYIHDGEVWATSTDGTGFIHNLLKSAPQLSLVGKKAIVLGAGGSAKAVIDALLRAGMAEILVLNRTAERVNDLKARFGPAIQTLHPDHFGAESKTAALFVNATSQGMKGQPALDVDISGLPPDAVVCDLVYVPLKSALLKTAEARGLRAVGGLGMLLHQAVEGFEKWFGVRPVVTSELYELVAKDIDPDYHP